MTKNVHKEQYTYQEIQSKHLNLPKSIKNPFWLTPSYHEFLNQILPNYYILPNKLSTIWKQYNNKYN